MKLFGPQAELTKLAQLIMSEDIEQLEQRYLSGLDINAVFHITEYIDETPITLALCENRLKVVDWLISKDVDLNSDNTPAIIMASSNCSKETVQLLLSKGADINAIDNVGKSVMNAALYGSNFELIPCLVSNGYNLKQDGVSLRQAIGNRQAQAVKLFLEYDIDVNYSVPNSVYPYNTSPFAEAVRINDYETVKLLIEHGADVSVKDAYGERAYHIATENKNRDIANIIKSLEPPEWHDESKRIEALKEYQLPKQLLDLMLSSKRRIDVDSEQIEYIEFSSIVNVKEVKWNGYKFLDLLSGVDNYSPEGFLIWYPGKNCLAIADYEHNEFELVTSVEEFFKNPGFHIDKRY